jgi:hypothetical protein
MIDGNIWSSAEKCGNPVINWTTIRFVSVLQSTKFVFMLSLRVLCFTPGRINLSCYLLLLTYLLIYLLTYLLTY